MTDLFSPLTLRGTEVPNRVMVSPMCQYSCAGDGVATDWHQVHLGSRAVGGAGIVMTEAAAVEPRGRISPQDLGIWHREHADALAPVAQFIRGQGSVPAIQLAHAGRKASTAPPADGGHPVHDESEGGWTPRGPTDTPFPRDEPLETEALDREDIEEVIDAFARSAQLSLDAGFEVAEVHAAHGYLLHEFCSPVTNTREDDYGGDFEGRTRLVREVTGAVREVWPDDKPVFVRVSATDWLPDRESWTVEDTVRLAGDLADVGADLVDVSAGGIHPDQQVPDPDPHYQVPYAEAVREEHGEDIRVGAVGKITTAEGANDVVSDGHADLAILGREHLRDPYFTLHAADEFDRMDDVDVPVQYHRAF
ncbi:NADH:flavin oxidoreductase/NADH oxidase [Halomarina litorea]|uniref:NADH:flavin oxidoreductase/NADH oxidase n=1 Tax=Halomarina litorea TaxID=2961595 RepID=UPI0020C4C009|nr:NADH:flavin oxidoreductase/NADH oxidase [Halomarina sp. BCD28]